MTDNKLMLKNDITLSGLGKTFALSGFFQDARDMNQAVVKILAGHELGIGPVASMRGVYIVEGRVMIGSKILAAIIGAHPRYGYDVVTYTDAECTLRATLDQEAMGEVTWTIEDAKKKGLTTGKKGPLPAWTKFPNRMLFARCISDIANAYFPDVGMGGAYVMEVDQDQDVEESRESIEVEAEVVIPDAEEGEGRERVDPEPEPVQQEQEEAAKDEQAEQAEKAPEQPQIGEKKGVKELF